ncbi:hypothetical protein LMG27174_05590 [Paraburkholderia rhynchosiae]|uniref:Uncharacterized protein n=1 Tax=Paraburkholderia rhynchosiae TaxID=487049 RepID=A0A2N7WBS0_9BURK|nr:hypothetical protein C0Z16_26645 [Paraburkholderia rhynchosiae]CAB3728586.1 hypothetical protein LMG27174_05590 [Paraburkholderia rhynchosiae]
MGALVALHAEATAMQRKTLYRLLYRYWTLGQIRNALLPNYENVGAPGKARVFAKRWMGMFVAPRREVRCAVETI